MTANELRIGNYLLKKEETIQISGQDIFNIWSTEILREPENYEPIEITEEWLLKFGFNEFRFNKHHCLQHNIMWRHPHDKKSVEKLNHSVNFYWQDKAFIFIELVNDHGEYGTYPLGHIKYVHQLQNAIFCLTGKEL